MRIIQKRMKWNIEQGYFAWNRYHCYKSIDWNYSKKIKVDFSIWKEIISDSIYFIFLNQVRGYRIYFTYEGTKTSKDEEMWLESLKCTTTTSFVQFTYLLTVLICWTSMMKPLCVYKTIDSEHYDLLQYIEKQSNLNVERHSLNILTRSSYWH